MKIFKILLLLLLSTNLLYSYEYTDLEQPQEELNDWNYFGEFKTYLAYLAKSVHRVTSDGKVINSYRRTLSYNSLQLSTDYYKDGFYFSATPYAYVYFEKDGLSVINGNYYKAFEFTDFFFRTLYVSYTFDKLTIGAGILPLSNSFPMQYTTDYFQDGEGLSIISDLDPLAVFMKYKFSDTNKILIGIGSLDTGFIPSGKYIEEHNIENSYGAFVVQTINHDKFIIINDFKYTKVMFDGKEAGEFYNIGSGISWDDTEYSGWTLYNVLAFSLYKNNAINVKNEILSSNPKFKKGYNSGKFASSFAFDNNNYYGAANLLGIRKDLDIFNFDSFINIEWFHTFNDWESANKGTPYNSNCNQISNIRNNSYFFNYGIRLSELTTLKFNYTFLEFDRQVNIGAPSSTIIDKSFGVKKDKSEIIKLSFSYKF